VGDTVIEKTMKNAGGEVRSGGSGGSASFLRVNNDKSFLASPGARVYKRMNNDSEVPVAELATGQDQDPDAVLEFVDMEAHM